MVAARYHQIDIIDNFARRLVRLARRPGRTYRSRVWRARAANLRRSRSFLFLGLLRRTLPQTPRRSRGRLLGRGGWRRQRRGGGYRRRLGGLRDAHNGLNCRFVVGILLTVGEGGKSVFEFLYMKKKELAGFLCARTKHKHKKLTSRFSPLSGPGEAAPRFKEKDMFFCKLIFVLLVLNRLRTGSLLLLLLG